MTGMGLVKANGMATRFKVVFAIDYLVAHAVSTPSGYDRILPSVKIFSKDRKRSTKGALAVQWCLRSLVILNGNKASMSSTVAAAGSRVKTSRR